jgi:hypothetical protein
MANAPVVCLHTDDAGCVWSLAPRGAFVKPRVLVNENSKPATYRVIGCRQNYALIENLYTSLAWHSKQSRLFVGSAMICSKVATCNDVLRRLAVLGVHDNLPNLWHIADNRSFHNYRTLNYFTQDRLSDWSTRLYREHCTAPFFAFLGLKREDVALQLISDICDPRWFVDANQPYSVSRLESFFGLRPDAFDRVWNSKGANLEDEVVARTLNLMSIVASLPKDSLVFSELQLVTDSCQHSLAACRLVLGFIARNWLAAVANPSHFEPELFFKRPENCKRFLAGFRG